MLYVGFKFIKKLFLFELSNVGMVQFFHCIFFLDMFSAISWEAVKGENQVEKESK